MKKNVIISVTGTHVSMDSQEPVEVVSYGTYYKRNGKVYVKYLEVTEDNVTLDCLVKIDADNEAVEITKKGQYSSCMVFKNDECCMTPYNTPFGALMLEITTKEMIILEDEDILIARLKYALDINYEHVAMCDIEVKVVSEP